MAMGTEVILRRKSDPVFPDRCTVCGKTQPGRTTRLWSQTTSWWNWLTLSFGWPYSVKVPACRSCGWKLQVWRWGGMILLMAIAFALMLFVAPLVTPLVPDRMRRFAIIGLASICLLPYLFWRVFFPGAIDLTVTRTTVTYEFQSREYAIEFATLNHEQLADDDRGGSG